jgi:hypothetical protein
MYIYENKLYGLIIPRIRNVSDNSRDNQTHILCPIILLSENRAVYEIMQKNMLQPERPQMAI